MFENLHYMPVLKWRQGEYLAMERLSNSVKDRCVPLFELPTEPWDFENAKAMKTLDEHLEKLGRRLKKSWGSRPCFFDSCHLPANATMDNGEHHLLRLFELARNEGARAVPVTGLTRGGPYQRAVAEIIAEDELGVCIRLKADDFGTSLRTSLTRLMLALDVASDTVDIVIDVEDDVLKAAKAQATVWSTYVGAVSAIARWRTITVVGSSFPGSLTPPSAFRPTGTIDRTEWMGYAELSKLKLSRIPTFGDYAAAAFKTEYLDPRFIDPNAKVKYTIDDKWLIAVGKKVRATGRAQYQDLCKAIRDHVPKVFEGRKFSWGDQFIADCAAGKGNGAPTTWPSVATNHHATKVTRDLAKLFGASSIP